MSDPLREAIARVRAEFTECGCPICGDQSPTSAEESHAPPRTHATAGCPFTVLLAAAAAHEREAAELAALRELERRVRAEMAASIAILPGPVEAQIAALSTLRGGTGQGGT